MLVKTGMALHGADDVPWAGCTEWHGIPMISGE
jgi:hypothetical protein